MGVEIVVPLGMFMMIFAIVATVMYYRFRTRQELQMTVRAAVESGQNLSPEVLEELMSSLESSPNDLRRGVLAIAIALAFTSMSFVIDQEETVALLAIAAFPFFVGVAYLGLWFFNRDDKAKS